MVKKEKKSLLRKLNIGSGNRPRPTDEGWINIDIDKGCNPDVVRNIDKGLPFDDNSVDEVYFSHVVEHVEDIFYTMYEIWRVCKPDAVVEIIAPNHAHLFSIYPNHHRFIRPNYFEMWFPTELINNAAMNYPQETFGAEFLSMNESIVENAGAIKFYLLVVKEGGEIKKHLKKFAATDRTLPFMFIPDFSKALPEIRKPRKEKTILNLGCGPTRIKPKDKNTEIIHIDKEPFWKPDIVRDIERGLPFDDNSIDEVHSEHLLEHVAPDNIDYFMYECWRVLKDKGKFTCIVPIGKSWMSSPYHKAPMSEMTPHFFTTWNHPEITGFKWKLTHKQLFKAVDIKTEKELDYADELRFTLEAEK